MSHTTGVAHEHISVVAVFRQAEGAGAARRDVAASRHVLAELALRSQDRLQHAGGHVAAAWAASAHHRHAHQVQCMCDVMTLRKYNIYAISNVWYTYI